MSKKDAPRAEDECFNFIVHAVSSNIYFQKKVVIGSYSIYGIRKKVTEAVVRKAYIYPIIKIRYI